MCVTNNAKNAPRTRSHFSWKNLRYIQYVKFHYSLFLTNSISSHGDKILIKSQYYVFLEFKRNLKRHVQILI